MGILATVQKSLKKLLPIVQAPITEAYGNCAEEIYFSLLRARREKRKVILLFPKDIGGMLVFSKMGLGVNNTLINVSSPHRMFSNGHFLVQILTVFLTIKGCLMLIVNALLIRLGMHHLKRDALKPTLGRHKLWPSINMEKNDWKQIDWSAEIHEDLEIRLTAEETKKAREAVYRLGLPSECWYVCVHAREGGFYGWKEGPGKQARNTSIEHYIPAIEYITSLGGWVVRLGDSTMRPLPSMKNVIDYLITEYKSSLLDVHLIKECTFYIGNNTGPWDVANLFGRPTVMPNMTDFSTGFPWRQGSLGILKRVYSLKEKKYLSVSEILNISLSDRDRIMMSDEFQLQENTAHEILCLVKEYLDGNNGQQSITHLQKKVASARIESANSILNDIKIDPVEKNRQISRLLGCKGNISSQYLEENWN